MIVLLNGNNKIFWAKVCFEQGRSNFSKVVMTFVEYEEVTKQLIRLEDFLLANRIGNNKKSSLSRCNICRLYYAFIQYTDCPLL